MTKRKDEDFVARGTYGIGNDASLFFENAKNESASFYDKMQKSNALPTLNYTQFNETLSSQERVNGKLFPRWNALSKVINPASAESTSAIMVAGDSQLENQIGVAKGFPLVDLQQDEIIMLQDVLDVLQLKKGDEVEIHYDIFQSAVSDLAKLKKILFDFRSY